MLKFNSQEEKIIEMAEPFIEKEYLKSMKFLRAPTLIILKLYAFVAGTYLIAKDVFIVTKEISWFSWDAIFLATSIVLFYERAIAFQIINKYRGKDKI